MSKSAFWRTYFGVLMVIISVVAIVANFGLPFFLAWQVGQHLSTPAMVLISAVAAALGWPCGVFLASQLPTMWRSLAWTPERYIAWRRAHEQ